MSTGAGSSGRLPSFQHKMEELLQCPVCMHFMFPPIFQCPNSHPLCSECKERLRTNSCSMCREELGSIGCLVLLQMARLVEFSCRFSSFGCEDILPYEIKLNHENRECKYRPYNCPLSPEDHCSVTGDIPHLFSHLKDDHMLDVYDGSSFKINYWQLNLPRHTIVINCFGKHFCLHFDAFTNRASTTFFSASLRFMGEIEQATQFDFSLEIKGTLRKLLSQCLIGTIHEITGMVLPRDGDELIIPLNSPLFILEAYHTLDIMEIEGHVWQIY